MISHISPSPVDLPSTIPFPPNPGHLPSAAHQVYQNDLILDTICGAIRSKAALRNLLIADKRCFIKAAEQLYKSVEQTTIDKLVQVRCNFARMCTYIHAVRELKLDGAYWPRDLEVATWSGQYPRLRFIRFAIPDSHGLKSQLQIFDTDERGNPNLSESGDKVKSIIGGLWIWIPCMHRPNWALHDEKLAIYGDTQRYHLLGLHLGPPLAWTRLSCDDYPNEAAVRAILSHPQVDGPASLPELKQYWKVVFRHTQKIALNCDIGVEFTAGLISASGNLKQLAITITNRQLPDHILTGGSNNQGSWHMLSDVVEKLERPLPPLEYLGAIHGGYPLSIFHFPFCIPAKEYALGSDLVRFRLKTLSLPVMPVQGDRASISQASAFHQKLPNTQAVTLVVGDAWKSLCPYTVGQVLCDVFPASQLVSFAPKIAFPPEFAHWQKHVRDSRLGRILAERLHVERGYRQNTDGTAGVSNPDVSARSWIDVPEAELDSLLVRMTHQQKAETADHFKLPFPDIKPIDGGKQKAGDGHQSGLQ